jgi:glutamate racemase
MATVRSATRRPAKPVRRAADVERAIGVFDSGVGGLTVLKAIADLLPREHLIYLGDTARLPYGTKSAESVVGYAIEGGDFLVDRGIKLLVVACNTMSAVAMDDLTRRYSVPVVGVIAPGARAAAQTTTRRRIGVIGTEATIASGSYPRELRAIDPSVEIFTRACPLFVPLAEEGWVDNDVARRTTALYLASLRKSGIDTLILGCTHYPLLRPAISDYMGHDVAIVDSADATAREVRRLLRDAGALRRAGRGSASFFVTDAAERFLRIGERIYGPSAGSAVRIVLRGEPGAAARRRSPAAF